MTIEKLFEILLTDKPSEVLKENEKELFNFIPAFKLCKNFNQHSEWHIYDVYEHILHVVDNVPANLEMRLAALFHDLGKPFTFELDKDNIGHFFGHWEVSQRLFLFFADMYNLDENLKKRVSSLIWYHDLNISHLDDNGLKEMYEELGLDGIEELFIFKRADLLAQNEKFYNKLDEYNIQREKVISRLIEMS